MSKSAEAVRSRAAAIPDGLETPRMYWATAVLLLTITVSVLDASMANVALPAIARDLNINPGDVVLIAIAYNLTVVSSILPLSAVAERMGFRRMLGWGVFLFIVMSFAAALSGSFWQIMSARIGQGVGSSMIMCLFGGLVRNIYPNRKLGFGLSLNASTVGLMAVLGPTLGAFILEVGSWQWIFLVTIPIGMLIFFGLRFLPDVPRNSGRFDWMACALSAPFFGLSILGLDALVKKPALAVLCFVLAGLAGWALVRRSRDQVAPLVPIDLLRIKPLAFAVAASGFSFAAQMSAFVALPFYFRHVLDYSYADVGLLLGAWSIGGAAMAPLAGYLSGRHPVAVLCGIGALSMASGMLSLIILPMDADFFWLVLGMLLAGIGFGFFQTPNNRALLAGAPRRRSGAAGGLQATTRVFGQSFGTALVAVSFNVSQQHGPVLAVAAGSVCALIALGVNIARYFSPIPDLDL